MFNAFNDAACQATELAVTSTATVVITTTITTTIPTTVISATIITIRVVVAWQLQCWLVSNSKKCHG